MKCKYCKSDNVIKYGKYNNVQLYYCKDCKRKFKADGSVFKMKTPANQVAAALNMYYEGMSIAAIRRNLQQQHGIMPSTGTIYDWIQKFTHYATDSVKGYLPKSVGDTWVADETVIRLDGQNVWLFDIIDDKTRFLLATRMTDRRKTSDAQLLFDRAVQAAGKYPKYVVTDKLASYLDVDYGGGTEHIQGGISRGGDDSTQKIERFHETLKQRTKVMRGLKNIESAVDFLNGWLVHYNYLRPHKSLRDITPAAKAYAGYPYKDWEDIVHHEPSQEIRVEHVPRGTLRLGETHVGRPRKRKRIKPPSSRLTMAQKARQRAREVMALPSITQVRPRKSKPKTKL